MRRVPPALVFVCVAGAALRLATLDLQSLWYDEAVTAQLLRMDLSGMLQAIPDSESSPPLYYVLAWLWTQLAGTGEVGLRSLSALLGTATIALVWALGRRLGGDRAGVIAAALVAVNPLLWWFSQEARAYALLALLATLAALLWLRALEQPRAGRAAAWSLVAALALATHYYAIFLVAPMALWIVLRAPDGRVRAAAVAPLAVTLAALAPLALGQRANGGAAFIGDSPLGTRVAQLPKQLLVGYDAPAEALLTVCSAALLLLAAVGLARLVAQGPRTAAARPAGARRDDALSLAAVTAAALALPAIAALAGEDHLITRNLLATAPLGGGLAGAGLAAIGRALPWVGRSAVAAACALGLVAVAGVAADPALQRDDWRGAVRALEHADGDRMLAATPGSALPPLRYYLPSARPLAVPAMLTSEIAYVAMAERSPGERPVPPRPAQPPVPPPAGFAPAARVQAQTFTVLRLRAAGPLPVHRDAVRIGLDGEPAAALVASR